MGLHVQVRALKKSYPHQRQVLTVLDRVDLRIERGEFVGIIGPSGCGKSTLLRMLAGLEPADAGEIRFYRAEEGGGPHGVMHGQQLGHVAYMFQQDLLLPWKSVLDNTILGLEASGVPRKQARARASAYFDRFGLAGFEHSYPAALSGGMRQRAALLRTVLAGKDLLLLDEPLGALDSLTRLEMQTWIQSVRAEVAQTVVLVTHDVDEALFLCDRVYVMSPRPGCIQAEMVVDLPQPRSHAVLAESDFAQLKREALGLLGVDLDGVHRRPTERAAR